MGCMRRKISMLGVAVGAFLGLSCTEPQYGSPSMSSEDAASATVSCVPGMVVLCSCADGQQGVASCQPNRSQLSACDCGPGSPASDGLLAPPSSMVGGARPGVGDTSTEEFPVTAGDGEPMAGEPMAGMAASGMSTAQAPDGPFDRRARDIRIREVAVYQPVKVPLVVDGAPVLERNAPVIVGKPALFRVAVEPLPGFDPREIEVELTLVSAEGVAAPMVATHAISRSSSDDRLDSTINFDVPAEAMAEDLRYAVTLREREGADLGDGAVDPQSRYPETEQQVALLGARSAGPLRVMIVPYRYTADGSNRMPILDEAQLELYKQSLYDRYPVSEIEVEVHDPVDYDAPVGPTTGWERYLDSHCFLRSREQPDPKVLYYGLLSPRDSLRAYGSGIVGISYLPNPAMNDGRCSVGVGFGGYVASTTMAHELGHALGLPHAPCGVSGDPFPYSEAKVGVWGYDRNARPGRELIDPDEAHDMMSYCEPNFISDYNFQKLFERVRYLNLQFSRITSAEPQTFLRVLRFADGHHEVTGRQSVYEPPGGPEDERPVILRDAGGQVMGEVPGYYIAASELNAGLWLVPDLGAASLYLDDGTEVMLP